MTTADFKLGDYRQLYCLEDGIAGAPAMRFLGYHKL